MRGLLRARWRSLHDLRRAGADGAFTRYYTPGEWRAVTGRLFEVASIRIYGLKSDILPLPHSRLKGAVMRMLPDAAARVLTSRLRMGSLFVAQMRKPDR
jgi:hypothetical protein